MVKTITWIGYGNSGGGALRDILCEFDNTCRFPGEFRLIKEYNGLLDLYEIITQSNDPERVELALKNYKWLSRNYARSVRRISKGGLGYDPITDNHFTQLTADYLERITLFSYNKNWHYTDFTKTSIEVFVRKVLSQFGITVDILTDKAAFSSLDADDFITYTREYIDEILTYFLKNQGRSEDTIVLISKALMPSSFKNIKTGIKFLKDTKVILIDREPIDIFLELYRSRRKRYLDLSGDMEKTAISFVAFYQSQRKQYKSLKDADNILVLNFENLVYEYETTLKKICDFCDLEYSQHINKMQYFDPGVSLKNVSLWKEMNPDEQALVNTILEYLNLSLPIVGECK